MAKIIEFYTPARFRWVKEMPERRRGMLIEFPQIQRTPIPATSPISAAAQMSH